jgi:DNA-binding LacI/PurR family transcriptional regulator
MAPLSTEPDGRTTIADVAAHAGVGVATVSRVLNESPLVAASTRARVQEAISALGYRPSRAARNLSLQRTHTVAALVPQFERASTLERLGGVVGRFADSSYDVALFSLERPERREREFALLADPGRVDGVLVVSMSPTDAEVARFRSAGIPVVVIDGQHTSVPSIVIDDTAGGELATRHLIDLGHRRIAFVGDPPGGPYHPTTRYGRLEGYRACLGEAGLSTPLEYVKQGAPERHVVHRLTQELLTLPEPPTAIFAGSDTQALGVLEAVQRAGLDVPGDVSIVGFDDVAFAAYVGLSTVRQPLRASGARGGELMLELLGGAPATPLCESLPLELVARKTAAPPQAGR